MCLSIKSAASPHRPNARLCVLVPKNKKEVRKINVSLSNYFILFAAVAIVLGSLYLDEMTLEPAKVTATLATAGLFQLDGIIDQCVEIMLESINIKVSR